jgi:hypothetical protein
VPGNDAIVHHVIVYRVSAQGAADAETLDAQEAGPGYTCYGGPRVDGQDLDLVVGWAPGSPPTYHPDGTGIRLEAGTKVVVQVHYYPLGAPGESDRTRVDLKLEDTVAREAQIALWSNNNFTLQPNQAVQTVQIEQDVGARVTVYGVFPHMHTLGTKMDVVAGTGGDERCLVRVPRWDFNWQQGFFYEDPIDLEQGDPITVTCSYDTTYRDTPTYAGDGTDDEMCVVLWYFALR